MKHMGEAWDVAYASLFLVSNQAKYITGQIIGLEGGIPHGRVIIKNIQPKEVG